mgnify:CR=1 FL=1|jgi:hypothetical protein
MYPYSFIYVYMNVEERAKMVLAVKGKSISNSESFDVTAAATVVVRQYKSVNKRIARRVVVKK